MTDTYKDLAKELKDIKKEEKGILATYYYLEKLKKHVLSRDVRGTRVALRRLGRVERRINRIHTRVVNHLQKVKNDFQNISNFEDYERLVAEFDHLSQKANVFFSQTVKEFTLRLGEIPKIFDSIAREETVDNDAWHQMEQHIVEMETSLVAWEELDKEMLKRGVDLEEKMGQVSAETSTRTIRELNIDEVMEGMGAFKQYSKKERDAIVVKYILYAMKNDPNLLVGKEIVDINFKNITFKVNRPKYTDRFFKFQNCIFDSCRFEEDIWGIYFEGCTISGCSIKGKLEDCEFYNYTGGLISSISNCDFSGQQIKHCNFEGIEISNTKLNSARIMTTGFLNVHFKDVHFFKAEIIGEYKDSKEIRGMMPTTFKESVLKRVYFVGSNIENTNFIDCNFEGVVDFRGVSFGMGKNYQTRIFESNVSITPQKMEELKGVVVFEGNNNTTPRFGG